VQCAFIKIISDTIHHTDDNQSQWKANADSYGENINQLIINVAHFLIYESQN
jgi:hypothetical protein